MARDSERYRRLVEPLLGRLLGAARRAADSREEAEEWVQETLLRGWRGFPALREEAAGYAWLRRILQTVIAEQGRQQARRRALVPILSVDDALFEATPASAPGPFETLVQRQSRDALLQALDSLPEEFARVLALRDLEGLRYREIAELLDIPAGTVMSRLSRGRRLLAARLLAEERQEDRGGGCP